MKKQYRIEALSFAKCVVILYHDGVEVERNRMWEDECDDYVDKLEDEGYTFGYSVDEVENARKNYEWRLEDIIKEG